MSSIVLSDPMDLRWAMAGMLNMHEDAPVEFCEMRIYHRGRLLETRQPADGQSVLDWSHEAAPDELSEPLLPWGHPVRVDSRTYHHGYNVIPPRWPVSTTAPDVSPQRGPACNGT